MSPIFLSLATVALRYQKELHAFTPAAYFISSGLVTFGIYLGAERHPMTMRQSFNILDYFIFVAVAALGVGGLITKTKALKHEKAARLSIIGFLQVVLMLFFDLFVVGTRFHIMEVVGMIIVLIANGLTAFSILRRRREELKNQEQLEINI